MPSRARPRGPTPSRAVPVILYGRNAVREALRGRRKVHRVWATEAARDQGWVGELARDLVAPKPASAQELDALCGSSDHQGVCAEAEAYPYADASALLEHEDALVLCLDQVQDPHNLGAVCRVAECAGAAGVVIPERRAAGVTPVVCRASAGAVEHLPVARVRNVADYLGEATHVGAWVYGAAAEAATSYDSPDYRGRVVLALGGEGRGLRPRVASKCDALISLPMHGRIDSLNVATAAAALLYGILQFRRRLDSRA